MGRKCKKECIDEDKVFCPSIGFEGGHCCEKEERSCPQPMGFCSSQNPVAPNSFKYYSCPNEKMCGHNIIVPEAYSHDKVVREIGFDSSEEFKNHDVCSYQVIAPDNMESTMKMYLEISSVENSEVWVSQVKAARGYKNEQRDLQIKAGESKKFAVTRDHGFFVSGWANTEDLQGTFKLRSWIVNDYSLDQAATGFDAPMTEVGPSMYNPNSNKNDDQTDIDAEKIVFDIPVNSVAAEYQFQQIQVYKEIEEESNSAVTLLLSVLIAIIVVVILAMTYLIVKRAKSEGKLDPKDAIKRTKLDDSSAKKVELPDN